VVFVSIDPERDNDAVLSEYVHFYSPEYVGVSGGIPALTQFAANLGAVFEKQPTGSGPLDYSMAHTASIFLINPNGELAMIARSREKDSFDWPQLRADVPAAIADLSSLYGAHQR
jgi:protein SCO1